jgi:hypothetical protein
MDAQPDPQEAPASLACNNKDEVDSRQDLIESAVTRTNIDAASVKNIHS